MRAPHMVADVDTQLLKTFRAVAETGSISRAAARLGYTQSAVSRQIGVLETTLGRALLDRLPRGVALTEAGQALLPHAQAVLERLDAAGLELEDLDQLRRGRLRVGAFATAISTLVPQALARFRSQHPQVTTTLTEGRTPELLRRLDAGEADVVVVSTAEGHNLHEPRYQLHHLLDEPMMLAVPRNHRLARRRTVRLAEFTGEVFVVGSRTDDQSFLQARLPADSPPRADIVVTGWNAKWGCVAAGLGVALVPSLAVRGTPGDIALLRLHRQDEAVRQVFAAVRAGRTIAPPVAPSCPSSVRWRPGSVDSDLKGPQLPTSAQPAQDHPHRQPENNHQRSAARGPQGDPGVPHHPVLRVQVVQLIAAGLVADGVGDDAELLIPEPGQLLVRKLDLALDLAAGQSPRGRAGLGGLPAATSAADDDAFRLFLRRARSCHGDLVPVVVPVGVGGDGPHGQAPRLATTRARPTTQTTAGIASFRSSPKMARVNPTTAIPIRIGP